MVDAEPDYLLLTSSTHLRLLHGQHPAPPPPPATTIYSTLLEPAEFPAFEVTKNSRRSKCMNFKISTSCYIVPPVAATKLETPESLIISIICLNI